MVSDKLYEIAFQYKKTKLWKKLWDTEVFAVKMSDGKIAFLSVMGRAGEYCAIGIYLGDDGFGSFRQLIGHKRPFTSIFAERERMLSQKCLHLAFENKKDLSEEELEDVTKYVRARGIHLGGKKAYPRFVKYEPNRYPWYLQSKEEEGYLYQAIDASIDLAGILTNHKPADVGIASVKEDTKDAPMMECVNGTYQFTERVALPEAKNPVYVRPKHWNEIRIANTKRQRRSGSWECELVLFPEPIQNKPYEVPYYPHILMAVSSETYFLLPSKPVVDYADHPDDVIDHLLECFIQQGWRPDEFRVRDNRTYELLEELAQKLKIPISIDDKLPALDDVEDRMIAQIGLDTDDEYEEFMAMFDALLQMDDDALRQMPQELLKQLEMMLEDEALPPDLAEALSEKLGL
jgi:hypothetical protein